MIPDLAASIVLATSKPRASGDDPTIGVMVALAES